VEEVVRGGGREKTPQAGGELKIPVL